MNDMLVILRELFHSLTPETGLVREGIWNLRLRDGRWISGNERFVMKI
jgi:hypothetical protein